MASVIYNGYKIIPAPIVNISKEYTRFGDNAKLGVNFVLTLTGKLFPCKGGLYTEPGYPADTVSSDKFQDILDKINDLKELFEDDGKTLEIQTDSGFTPLRCYPTVRNMTFPEEIWVDYADYTIVLEAPFVYGLDSNLDDDTLSLYLSEASEEWTLEFANEAQTVENQHVFNLQHNISAIGKQVYDADGLISTGLSEAKKWVGTKLGLNNTFLYSTSGLNLAETYNAYNHVRNEISDPYNGKYNISETWLVAKSNITENFNVSTKTSIDTGITTVTLEGNINGLETNTADIITSTKWNAASGYWSTLSTNLYSRAQTYANIDSINVNPLNTSVLNSPIEGRIQYTYEYDTRPSNCVTGATYENISIKDSNPADIFASIPIIGRSIGPILQNMNTITERKKSINIEVVMPISTVACTLSALNTYSPKATIDALIVGWKAELAGTYNQIFTTVNEEEWSPKTGRYTRQIEWVLQSCT